MNKSVIASVIWDRIGLSVSGICAIHCLFFPVFLTILPLWPLAFEIHEWVHPVFIILLLPVVFFASRRSHFDKWISTLLVTGFLLLLGGWLLGHYWLGFWFETATTLLGSGILITGHWMNYRHHQTCKNESHLHHPEVENIETP